LVVGGVRTRPAFASARKTLWDRERPELGNPLLRPQVAL
jgi:hypothetical protein